MVREPKGVVVDIPRLGVFVFFTIITTQKASAIKHTTMATMAVTITVQDSENNHNKQSGEHETCLIRRYTILTGGTEEGYQSFTPSRGVKTVTIYIPFLTETLASFLLT